MNTYNKKNIDGISREVDYADLDSNFRTNARDDSGDLRITNMKAVVVENTTGNAGAANEILVSGAADKTAKPSGYPVTMPTSGVLQNALDNSYFDVDQYGKSGNSVAISEYYIDRWYVDLGAITAPTYTLTENDGTQPIEGANTIKLTAVSTEAGQMRHAQDLPLQKIKKYRNKNAYTSVYVRGTVGRTLKLYSFNGSSYSSVSVVADGTWQPLEVATNITASATTIQTLIGYDSVTAGDYVEICAPQLCAGSVRLPENPKGYDAELAECQRHARISKTNNMGFRMYDYTVDTMRFHIPYSMISSPSLIGTINVDYVVALLNGGSLGFTSATVSDWDENGFNVVATKTAHGFTDCRIVFFVGAGFDANL